MDIKFGLIIPAILSLFILKEYPLISITNISIVCINFSLIAGTIMLPYSIDLDRFHVADPTLYASSISKSIIFIWFPSEIYVNVLSRNAEAGIFVISILFFVMQHLVLGVFSDGSGAIQTFIIRAGITAAILSALMFRTCHGKQEVCF